VTIKPERDPITKELREKREERNVTVAELSRMLGVPKERIHKWDQSKSAPKYNDRIKIQNWIKATNWKDFPLNEPEKKLAIDLEKEAMAKELLHLKATVKAQGALLIKTASQVSGRSVEEISKDLRDSTSLIMLDQAGT